MKINGPDGRASGVSQSPRVRSPVGGTVSAPRPDSSGSDNVDLSSLARLAAAAGSSNGTSNVAKLSALSETVLSGAYQVDAVVVSNSIIDASMRLEGGSL